MNNVRLFIRRQIRKVASMINRYSRGSITPDMITIVGLGAHFFIAYFIAINWWVLAAILLIVFGLFDTLDGELARLQKKASACGMLLDATTDRLKETLIYTGLGVSLALSDQSFYAALAVLACGMSLCVSYIKAKGEAALISSKKDIPHARLNRLFSDGIAPFEVRIGIVIAGLLLHVPVLCLAAIIVLTSFTATTRFVNISRELGKV